jgi:hypothetical protein
MISTVTTTVTTVATLAMGATLGALATLLLILLLSAKEVSTADTRRTLTDPREKPRRKHNPTTNSLHC